MDKDKKIFDEILDDSEELLASDLTRHHDDNDPDDPDDDALLTYSDKVLFDDSPIFCIDSDDLCQKIRVRPDIKIFAKKFMHSEADCFGCKHGLPFYPTEGDAIGFTLVLGNLGSKDYNASSGSVTLEDELKISRGLTLKLVDLCVPEGYELVRVGRGGRAIPLKPCPKHDSHDDDDDDNNNNRHSSNGDNNGHHHGSRESYMFKGTREPITLRLRRVSGRRSNYDIDLPAYSIFCICMLFQIVDSDSDFGPGSGGHGGNDSNGCNDGNGGHGGNGGNGSNGGNDGNGGNGHHHGSGKSKSRDDD